MNLDLSTKINHYRITIGGTWKKCLPTRRFDQFSDCTVITAGRRFFYWTLIMIKKIKLILLLTSAFSLLALSTGYLANHYLLQTKMDDILIEDSRNEGLDVTLRYKNLFNFKHLVVNYTEVEPPSSRLSAFRCLFQIARTVSNKKFAKVTIAYRGKPKVFLEGDSFSHLGNNYGSKESLKMLLYLATNLRHLNGERMLLHSESYYTALLEEKIAETRAYETMQDAAADSLFYAISKHN